MYIHIYIYIYMGSIHLQVCSYANTAQSNDDQSQIALTEYLSVAPHTFYYAILQLLRKAMMTQQKVSQLSMHRLSHFTGPFFRKIFREEIDIYIYNYIYIYIHIFTYIQYIYAYIYTYVHVYIFTYLHMYIFTYIHIYIYKYTYMFLHVSECMQFPSRPP